MATADPKVSDKFNLPPFASVPIWKEVREGNWEDGVLALVSAALVKIGS